MIELLTGFSILVAVLFILYGTGKLSGRWSTDRDKWDERDYLGKGIAIWLLIGIIATACFVVGNLILEFI